MKTEEILKAFTIELDGFSPAIVCKKYPQFAQPVLAQVQLCFDQNLYPVDCSTFMTSNDIFGDCPKNGHILYPKIEDNDKGLCLSIRIGK